MNRLLQLGLFYGIAAAAGCAERVSSPDRALDDLAKAAQNGDCRAVFRMLDEDARAGRDAAEFDAWCHEHLDLFAAQGLALERSLRSSEAAVVARLPIDSSRAVATVHHGNRWFVDGHVALPFGGDTPVEAAVNLAALIEGDGMQALMSMMSPSMRDVYTAEIRTLASALRDGVADIVVYGETATIAVGDINVRFVVEDGVWRVDSITQAYYDYYEY
jgi:hypothetical protein